MNIYKLALQDRARILHVLCEGQSIRPITRVMDVSKNTVARLLNDAGAVCAAYQDEALRNLTSKRVPLNLSLLIHGSGSVGVPNAGNNSE
ncbi:helix-turn-helix domain-containing protein [Mesorhizobium sp. M1B.F.Ca.ET.045.04.1.1]|nr:helix-turn-helix domain-containing protein [Mesorhizobium sp. M1B.F.Ca.ET.045.04.1.1]RWB18567.1 MAG: helix-turn-helix domain-containing protein [Mesorhizobium sp.]